jgi:aminopeptidase YwaD
MKRISCKPVFFLRFSFRMILMFSLSLFFYIDAFAQYRSLVPPTILDAVLDEYSGEFAQRHIELLSVNRNRQASEYQDKFFETDYLLNQLERYGMSDVRVDFFPSGKIWDAEEAELWLIQPVKKKIASLNLVPAALASGSMSADIETEVVYVGFGRQSDYADKDVEGKIVFGTASVGSIFNSGVVQRNAAGALGTGSWGVSVNSPGYSSEQIGWQRVSPVEEKGGFGFVLSKRQTEEIRAYIDRGLKVVMKAHIRTTMYPYKMNVISATIAGTGELEGELVFAAHVFERIGTPGAHDNTSGVAVLLEMGRTLSELIERGELDRPKRTIRFLWIPEHAGTRAYMYKYPQLQDNLLAAINFDMSGPDLEITDSYLRMKLTPDSRPSYLNALVRDLLRYTDQTDVRTQWGNNSPFNYRIVPFIMGSDHIQFLNAGIPAVQFGHWNDNFYHTSEDRSRYTDPTELKRVGFMGASAFYYLANAGASEARYLAWESAANGDKWIAEVTRQSIRLLESGSIHERYKAAQNKVGWAVRRAVANVRSVLEIARDDTVGKQVESLVKSLEKNGENQADRLEYVYKEKCTILNEKPRKLSRTKEEKELARLVPSNRFKYYSDGYRTHAADINQYLSGESKRLPGLAQFEVPNFIDGKKSILDIYNAVRAEYGNVTTNNNEWKFAYVVTPVTDDISIGSVKEYIDAMERAGLIEITKK